jgi:hypothetical protein
MSTETNRKSYKRKQYDGNYINQQKKSRSTPYGSIREAYDDCAVDDIMEPMTQLSVVTLIRNCKILEATLIDESYFDLYNRALISDNKLVRYL